MGVYFADTGARASGPTGAGLGPIGARNLRERAKRRSTRASAEGPGSFCPAWDPLTLGFGQAGPNVAPKAGPVDRKRYLINPD